VRACAGWKASRSESRNRTVRRELIISSSAAAGSAAKV
jgi:hypothetical protein